MTNETSQAQSSEKSPAEMAASLVAENALEGALGGGGRIPPVRQPTLIERPRGAGQVASIEGHFRDSGLKRDDDGQKTQALIDKLEKELVDDTNEFAALSNRINARVAQLNELRTHITRLKLTRHLHGETTQGRPANAH